MIPAAVLAAATEALRGSPQIQCRVRCASRTWTDTRGPCDCTSPEVAARDTVAAALVALGECEETESTIEEAGCVLYPHRSMCVTSTAHDDDVTLMHPPCILAALAGLSQP